MQSEAFCSCASSARDRGTDSFPFILILVVVQVPEQSFLGLAASLKMFSATFESVVELSLSQTSRMKGTQRVSF